jgi:hypothetical protein
MNKENYSKFTALFYSKIFGSWVKFLDEIGEKARRLNYPDEYFINLYEELCEKTGKKILTRSEYDKLGGKQSYLFTSHFGSFEIFLKKMGIEIPRRKPNICLNCKKKFIFPPCRGNQLYCSRKCKKENHRKKLFIECLRIKNKIGHFPNTSEWKKNKKILARYTSILNKFGSWSNFINEVQKSQKKTKASYMKSWQNRNTQNGSG